jgi:hypothetical protein
MLVKFPAIAVHKVLCVLSSTECMHSVCTTVMAVAASPLRGVCCIFYPSVNSFYAPLNIFVQLACIPESSFRRL